MTKEQRLIESSDLEDRINQLALNVFGLRNGRGVVGDILGRFRYCVIEEIRKSRTVDAAEVVHAEWLDIRFDSMWKSMLATCSHCEVRGEVRAKSNGCGFAVPDSDYCPHCGAKMSGGV